MGDSKEETKQEPRTKRSVKKIKIKKSTKIEPTLTESKTTAKNSSTKEDRPHYEFGGPLGTLGCIIMLPLVIYFLYFYCTKQKCYTCQDLISELFEIKNFDYKSVFDQVTSIPIESAKLVTAFTYCVLWFLFLVILERTLPGDIALGVPLMVPSPP